MPESLDIVLTIKHYISSMVHYMNYFGLRQNEHQMQIDTKLYQNIQSLFSIDQSIVIYDLSNLYFEGRKAKSKIAKFGRSKEKRNDCKQVVFNGIIDNKGFIKHSKIYEGNTVDCNTIEDMLNDFESQNIDIKNVTIVMDAGFATKENLELIQSKKMKYVSVARNKIKNFMPHNDNDIVKVLDNKGNAIDLQLLKSEKHNDTWMYVKSEQKRIKENSMSMKLEARFEEELQSINDGLSRKRTIKDSLNISERIGRLKQKHKWISGRYNIDIKIEKNKATAISWKKSSNDNTQYNKHGVYFIRTNYTDIQEKKLWDIYNLIRDVEATFRCLKSDLLIRPVYHQTDIRIKGHIYQTIYSYQIVNAIRTYLKDNNINLDWQNIVRILSTQTLNRIELPTKTKKLTIEKISKPISEVQKIYDILGIKVSRKSKKVHVVYH